MDSKLLERLIAEKKAYLEEYEQLEQHPIIQGIFKNYRYWDGKFHNEGTKQYKISLCTTCMGRLECLKKSLPKNIEDNADYPNLEFLVLDYNSKDGLWDWIKNDMMEHIESGRVVYCRTEDPEFYSMTHSRNLAFKLASGDIVNNVDADNYTNHGFASYLNKLANEVHQKAVFAKGRRMLRGRLGFFKHEFIDILGGYEEGIKDYGHDDHDLLYRAWAFGFRLMYFGGKYYSNTGSKKHQTVNMKNPYWRNTEIRNKVISAKNIIDGKLKANWGKEWGKAHIIRNFTEELDL